MGMREADSSNQNCHKWPYENARHALLSFWKGCRGGVMTGVGREGIYLGVQLDRRGGTEGRDAVEGVDPAAKVCALHFEIAYPFPLFVHMPPIAVVYV